LADTPWDTYSRLLTRLTRLYEREDWQARFAASKNEEPLLLERGVSVNVQPTFAQIESPKPPMKDNPDNFAEAAKQRMAEAKAGKAKPNSISPTMTDIRAMKNRAQQRQTAKIAGQGAGEHVSRQE
jgi:hypothetical protein